MLGQIVDGIRSARSGRSPFQRGPSSPKGELGWRQDRRTGDLHIDSKSLPAKISFDVFRGRAGGRDRPQFTARVLVDRQLAHPVSLLAGESTKSVQLQLGPSTSGANIQVDGGLSLSNVRLQPWDDSRICPACLQKSASEGERLGPLKYTCDYIGRGVDRHYDLIECGGCGLIYQTPLPSPKEFEEMYIGHTQFDGDNYNGEHAKVILGFISHRLNALIAQIGTDEVRVLEIGSGLGWMCRATKERNRGAKTVAQDISPEVIDVCNWVDHYYLGELSSLMDQLKTHGPYDIISITHVIEHVPDPVDILRLCGELVGPNGIIFVTAPHRPLGWQEMRSLDSWQAWGLNHVPAHLQYFHANSMLKCAENAKLKVKYFSDREAGGEAFEAWLVRP